MLKKKLRNCRLIQTKIWVVKSSDKTLLKISIVSVLLFFGSKATTFLKNTEPAKSDDAALGYDYAQSKLGYYR